GHVADDGVEPLQRGLGVEALLREDEQPATDDRGGCRCAAQAGTERAEPVAEPTDLTGREGRARGGEPQPVERALAGALHPPGAGVGRLGGRREVIQRRLGVGVSASTVMLAWVASTSAERLERASSACEVSAWTGTLPSTASIAESTVSVTPDA